MKKNTHKTTHAQGILARLRFFLVALSLTTLLACGGNGQTDEPDSATPDTGTGDSPGEGNGGGDEAAKGIVSLTNEDGNTVTWLDSENAVYINVTVSGVELPAAITLETTKGAIRQATITTDIDGTAQTVLSTLGEKDDIGQGTLTVKLGADTIGSYAFDVRELPEPEIRISILDETGAQDNSLPQNGKARIIAQLREDFTEQVIVEFRTDHGTLDAFTALSKAGKAEVVLNAGQEIGAGEITANVRGSNYPSKALFDVVSADKEQIDLQLFNAQSNDATNELSTSTPLLVVASLDSAPANSLIEFSSTIGVLSSTVALTNAQGIAKIELFSDGTVGAGTITAKLQGSSDTSTTNFQSVQDGNQNFQLLYVSADPTVIALPGSGQNQQSVITYRLLDSRSQAVKGEIIDFELVNPGSAELLIEQATTDADGYASTRIKSGNVAASVRVVASLRNSTPAIEVRSSTVAVASGLPDQNSSSMSASQLNVEAMNQDGVELGFTMRLGDQFNNLVPDGIQVQFRPEAAAAEANCTSFNSACSVKLISQGDRPRIAAEAVTSNCFFLTPNAQITARCAGNRTVDFPLSGRINVIGYAIGQESFDDKNANGLFDTMEELESFLNGSKNTEQPYDVPEAFIDKDESNTFNDADSYIDFNQNQRFDGADGKYNGILCRTDDEPRLIPYCPDPDNADPAIASIPEGIHVRGQSTVVYSTADAYFTVLGLAPDASTPSVAQPIVVKPDDSKTLTIIISDGYNNPMAGGTNVAIVPENVTLANGETNFKLRDSITSGGHRFKLGFKLNKAELGEDPIKQGSIRIVVTSTSGIESGLLIEIHNQDNPPTP